MKFHHRAAIASWALGVCLLAPSNTSGQVIGLGTEFQVNAYTIGYQIGPSVAIGGDGGFAVVWIDGYPNDVDFRIIARRFSSAGAPLAAEFQVNSVGVHLFTTAFAAAGAADGGFVVAWSRPSDEGRTVVARRFSSTGDPVTGELQVNLHPLADLPFGQPPDVASDPDGDFVVTWARREPTHYDGVVARRFTSAGVALTDELQVDVQTVVWRPFPVVAADADGDFVVVWRRLASTDYPTWYDIAGRRFSSEGLHLTSEFQVNTHSIHYFASPFSAVAAEGDGDFVVTWNGLTEDNYALAVLARRFSSTASPLTEVFQVNAHPTSAGRSPSAAIVDGNFLIAWNSFDGSGRGVLARLFASTGAIDVLVSWCLGAHASSC